MKTKLLIAMLVLSLTGGAQAAGCLKGAAVGGLVGHHVGKGHAVLGAVAGCMVGRHIAKAEKKKETERRVYHAGT